MSSSTRTTAAQGNHCVRTFSARNLFCLVTILMLAIVTTSAQTIVTPNTTTIQYLGVPNPQNNTAAAVTAPLGGIILNGISSVNPINPATGQFLCVENSTPCIPERHLWVDDATAGICRVDPDLDSPGPYAINLQTCPFKINGASITGGPFSFDPTPRFLDPKNPKIATNYLYFADEQRASEGIIRIGYLATGDGGHGFLNFASIFIMGGSTTGARFGGGTTGCAIPGNPGTPHATVLDPLGNLWVGYKKSPTIVRFNQPGTASDTGFGTCAQFITTVATDSKLTQGLAFVGHDLWGADGTSPFVIKNADTTCMVPPHGICLAPADIVGVLAAAPVGATAVAVMSDQYYPATNGNNVYFALQQAPAVPPAPQVLPDNVAWLGNAATVDPTLPNPTVNTTLDVTFMGTFSPAGGPSPAVAFLSGVAVDQSDPANIVVYSSDDYTGAGQLAKGMWFQSCQGNPPASPPALGFTPNNCPPPGSTATPGVPLNVFAVAGPSQATVSWSPAQSNVAVNSYTVHNSFASNGLPVADVIITPGPGATFPATSTVITGLVNTGLVGYAFQVSATNSFAPPTSGFSLQSNTVFPPGIPPPNKPGTPSAIAGDTQASVSFPVSTPLQGATITSYLVTSNPGGIVGSTPPPASGNIGTVLVGGLTNGVSYTFTVEAIDITGTSGKSSPSNAVIPSAAQVPVISATISGPSSVTTAPSQVSYTITVSNPSAFPANVSVTHTLSPVPAAISATGASRNAATGVVTITTTGSHGLNIGQSITIAGVTDASFNGTFVIQDVPTPTTLTYAQAGLTATSGSGTVTGLPLANILLAQTSQGTCTAGGAGVITVTCNQGSLPAGASSTMTVIVQIQSQAILNSVVASGTDAAGTALANSATSLQTTVPLPAISSISAPVSVTGTPQSPTPNVGAPDSITWKVINVSTTPTPNVVFTMFFPTGLTINAPNPPTPTFDNGGTGSCTASTPVPGGNQIVCTSPTLGGPRKNGAKPPSTMTVITTVTATAAIRNIPVKPSGTVTFGPNGIDTLPNTLTLTITAK
jgi:hypothetical protein